MIRALALLACLGAQSARAMDLPILAPEELRLVSVESQAPEPIPADGLKGASGAVLSYRACFSTTLSLAMASETYRVYPEAAPAPGPFWLGCFDALQLDKDIEKGEAVAFLSEPEIATGVDRVIAVYPDGRAYAWHQLNENAEK